MKTLKREPMNKIIILTVGLLSFNLLASEGQFGRIVDLKGGGFISSNGKTREIKKGDIIEMGSEIVIEHQGQVTFTDNADHRYHLGNSTSVAVTNKGVELRAGDLWFQSLNKTDVSTIKTANALIEYNGGEAIVTYDTQKGKSQLMVINGMMKLANLRQTDLNLSVGEGHFSFVDNSYDEGAPRDPTPVGEKTYRELVTLFNGVAPMDKHSEEIFKGHDKNNQHTAEAPASRAIASTAMIEEYKNDLLEKKVAKKAVIHKEVKPKIVSVEKKKTTKEKVVVHIYGQTSAPTVAYTMDMAPSKKAENMRSRAPASVLDQEVPVDSAVESKPSTPATTAPYTKEYRNENKESDKLIEDLKKL